MEVADSPPGIHIPAAQNQRGLHSGREFEPRSPQIPLVSSVPAIVDSINPQVSLVQITEGQHLRQPESGPTYWSEPRNTVISYVSSVAANQVLERNCTNEPQESHVRPHQEQRQLDNRGQELAQRTSVISYVSSDRTVESSSKLQEYYLAAPGCSSDMVHQLFQWKAVVVLERLTEQFIKASCQGKKTRGRKAGMLTGCQKIDPPNKSVPQTGRGNKKTVNNATQVGKRAKKMPIKSDATSRGAEKQIAIEQTPESGCSENKTPVKNVTVTTDSDKKPPVNNVPSGSGPEKTKPVKNATPSGELRKKTNVKRPTMSKTSEPDKRESVKSVGLNIKPDKLITVKSATPRGASETDLTVTVKRRKTESRKTKESESVTLINSKLEETVSVKNVKQTVRSGRKISVTLDISTEAVMSVKTVMPSWEIENEILVKNVTLSSPSESEKKMSVVAASPILNSKPETAMRIKTEITGRESEEELSVRNVTTRRSSESEKKVSHSVERVTLNSRPEKAMSARSVKPCIESENKILFKSYKPSGESETRTLVKRVTPSIESQKTTSVQSVKLSSSESEKTMLVKNVKPSSESEKRNMVRSVKPSSESEKTTLVESVKPSSESEKRNLVKSVKPSSESEKATLVESVKPSSESEKRNLVKSVKPSSESEKATLVKSVKPSSESEKATLVKSVKPSSESEKRNLVKSVKPSSESEKATLVKSVKPSSESEKATVVKSVKPSSESEKTTLVKSVKRSSESETTTSVKSVKPSSESETTTSVKSVKPSSESEKTTLVKNVKPSSESEKTTLVRSVKPSSESETTTSVKSVKPSSESEKATVAKSVKPSSESEKTTLVKSVKRSSESETTTSVKSVKPSSESETTTSVKSVKPSSESETTTSVKSVKPSSESEKATVVKSVKPSSESEKTTLVKSVKRSSESETTTSVKSVKPSSESETTTSVKSVKPSSESEKTTLVKNVKPSSESEKTTLVRSVKPSSESETTTSVKSVKPSSESETTTSVKSVKPRSESETRTSVKSVKPSSESETTTSVKSVKPSSESEKTTLVKNVKPSSESEKTTLVKSVKPSSESEKTTLVRSVKPSNESETTTSVKSVKPSSESETTTSVKSVKPRSESQTTSVKSVKPSSESKTTTSVKSVKPSSESETTTSVKSVMPRSESEKTTLVKNVKPSSESEKMTLVRSVKPSSESKTTTSVKSVKPRSESKTTTSVKSVKPSSESETTTSVKSVMPSSESETKTSVKSVKPRSESKTTTSVKSVKPSSESETTTSVKSVMPSSESETTTSVKSVKPRSESEKTTLVKNVKPSSESEKTTLVRSVKPSSESETTTSVKSVKPSSESETTTSVKSVKPSSESETTTSVKSVKPSSESENLVSVKSATFISESKKEMLVKNVMLHTVAEKTMQVKTSTPSFVSNKKMAFESRPVPSDLKLTTCIDSVGPGSGREHESGNSKKPIGNLLTMPSIEKSSKIKHLTGPSNFYDDFEKISTVENTTSSSLEAISVEKSSCSGLNNNLIVEMLSSSCVLEKQSNITQVEKSTSEKTQSSSVQADLKENKHLQLCEEISVAGVNDAKVNTNCNTNPSRKSTLSPEKESVPLTPDSDDSSDTMKTLLVSKYKEFMLIPWLDETQPSSGVTRECSSTNVIEKPIVSSCQTDVSVILDKSARKSPLDPKCKESMILPCADMPESLPISESKESVILPSEDETRSTTGSTNVGSQIDSQSKDVIEKPMLSSFHQTHVLFTLNTSGTASSQIVSKPLSVPKQKEPMILPSEILESSDPTNVGVNIDKQSKDVTEKVILASLQTGVAVTLNTSTASSTANVPKSPVSMGKESMILPLVEDPQIPSDSTNVGAEMDKQSKYIGGKPMISSLQAHVSVPLNTSSSSSPIVSKSLAVSKRKEPIVLPLEENTRIPSGLTNVGLEVDSQPKDISDKPINSSFQTDVLATLNSKVSSESLHVSKQNESGILPLLEETPVPFASTGVGSETNNQSKDVIEKPDLPSLQTDLSLTQNSYVMVPMDTNLCPGIGTYGNSCSTLRTQRPVKAKCSEVPTNLQSKTTPLPYVNQNHNKDKIQPCEHIQDSKRENNQGDQVTSIKNQKTLHADIGGVLQSSMPQSPSSEVSAIPKKSPQMHASKSLKSIDRIASEPKNIDKSTKKRKTNDDAKCNQNHSQRNIKNSALRKAGKVLKKRKSEVSDITEPVMKSPKKNEKHASIGQTGEKPINRNNTSVSQTTGTSSLEKARISPSMVITSNSKCPPSKRKILEPTLCPQEEEILEIVDSSLPASKKKKLKSTCSSIPSAKVDLTVTTPGVANTSDNMDIGISDVKDYDPSVSENPIDSIATDLTDKNDEVWIIDDEDDNKANVPSFQFIDCSQPLDPLCGWSNNVLQFVDEQDVDEGIEVVWETKNTAAVSKLLTEQTMLDAASILAEKEASVDMSLDEVEYLGTTQLSTTARVPPLAAGMALQPLAADAHSTGHSFSTPSAQVVAKDSVISQRQTNNSLALRMEQFIADRHSGHTSSTPLAHAQQQTTNSSAIPVQQGAAIRSTGHTFSAPLRQVVTNNSVIPQQQSTNSSAIPVQQGAAIRSTGHTFSAPLRQVVTNNSVIPQQQSTNSSAIPVQQGAAIRSTGHTFSTPLPQVVTSNSVIPQQQSTNSSAIPVQQGAAIRSTGHTFSTPLPQVVTNNSVIPQQQSTNSSAIPVQQGAAIHSTGHTSSTPLLLVLANPSVISQHQFIHAVPLQQVAAKCSTGPTSSTPLSQVVTNNSVIHPQQTTNSGLSETYTSAPNTKVVPPSTKGMSLLDQIAQLTILVTNIYVEYIVIQKMTINLSKNPNLTDKATVEARRSKFKTNFTAAVRLVQMYNKSVAGCLTNIVVVKCIYDQLNVFMDNCHRKHITKELFFTLYYTLLGADRDLIRTIEEMCGAVDITPAMNSLLNLDPDLIKWVKDSLKSRSVANANVSKQNGPTIPEESYDKPTNAPHSTPVTQAMSNIVQNVGNAVQACRVSFALKSPISSTGNVQQSSRLTSSTGGAPVTQSSPQNVLPLQNKGTVGSVDIPSVSCPSYIQRQSRPLYPAADSTSTPVTASSSITAQQLYNQVIYRQLACTSNSGVPSQGQIASPSSSENSSLNNHQQNIPPVPASHSSHQLGSSIPPLVYKQTTMTPVSVGTVSSAPSPARNSLQAQQDRTSSMATAPTTMLPPKYSLQPHQQSTHTSSESRPSGPSSQSSSVRNSLDARQQQTRPRTSTSASAPQHPQQIVSQPIPSINSRHVPYQTNAAPASSQQNNVTNQSDAGPRTHAQSASLSRQQGSPASAQRPHVPPDTARTSIVAQSSVRPSNVRPQDDVRLGDSSTLASQNALTRQHPSERRQVYKIIGGTQPTSYVYAPSVASQQAYGYQTNGTVPGAPVQQTCDVARQGDLNETIPYSTPTYSYPQNILTSTVGEYRPVEVRSRVTSSSVARGGVVQGQVYTNDLPTQLLVPAQVVSVTEAIVVSNTVRTQCNPADGNPPPPYATIPPAETRSRPSNPHSASQSLVNFMRRNTNNYSDNPAVQEYYEKLGASVVRRPPTGTVHHVPQKPVQTVEPLQRSSQMYQNVQSVPPAGQNQNQDGAVLKSYTHPPACRQRCVCGLSDTIEANKQTSPHSSSVHNMRHNAEYISSNCLEGDKGNARTMNVNSNSGSNRNNYSNVSRLENLLTAKPTSDIAPASSFPIAEKTPAVRQQQQQQVARRGNTLPSTVPSQGNTGLEPARQPRRGDGTNQRICDQGQTSLGMEDVWPQDYELSQYEDVLPTVGDGGSRAAGQPVNRQEVASVRQSSVGSSGTLSSVGSPSNQTGETTTTTTTPVFMNPRRAEDAPPSNQVKPAVICNMCPNVAKLMCSQCRNRCYCGQDCQSLDWVTNHERDCASMCIQD